MKRIIAIVFAMISVCAIAGQPPPDFKLVETTYSPRRTFEFEHYFYSGTNKPTNYYWQHWITNGKKSHNRTLLYESDEYIETLISPDDTWIVLNDRLGSTDTVTLLFRKSEGITFHAVTNIDLRAEAFHAAAIQQGYATSQVFEHSYCQALCWVGSHALVLYAWGHADDEPAQLKDWYCIYDIKSRQVSFDLTAVNKGAFECISRQAMTRDKK